MAGFFIEDLCYLFFDQAGAIFIPVPVSCLRPPPVISIIQITPSVVAKVIHFESGDHDRG